MPSRPAGALLWSATVFLAATLVLTWPLAASLTVSLPGDLGDPLFVTWAIGWVSGVLTASLTNPEHLSGLWNANIFFPERQTLAFSENFIGQSVMVLPAYWITGNSILAYNLAFIASFVLTGAGTFLLARALTRSAAGALVAGAIAAFNEYRLVYEIAHLHVLSVHWFPFALLGLHRYFETDRRRYLAGSAAALIALNFSSVYYMAYSAPLVAIFAAFELLYWKRWRTLRVWLELWAASAIVLVASIPVLRPYMDVQQRLGIERPVAEVVQFSLTLDSYRTGLAGLAPALALAAAAWFGCFGRRADRRVRWTVVTLTVLTAMSVWLSLGPLARSSADSVGIPGLYAAFYEWVPGFKGLRVPGRYASFVFVCLGVVAAAGVAMLEQRWRPASRVVAAVTTVLFAAIASPGPMPLNQALPSPDLQPPPPYLTPSPDLQGIYRWVDTLPAGAVLAEFPFGDYWYDLRYMYFASMHRRRLINGYSGIFPPSFVARQRVLARPALDPDRAAAALAGVTHAVVHRAAWRDNSGDVIAGWLTAGNARIVAESDRAILFELPIVEEFAATAQRRE